VLADSLQVPCGKQRLELVSGSPGNSDGAEPFLAKSREDFQS